MLLNFKRDLQKVTELIHVTSTFLTKCFLLKTHKHAIHYFMSVDQIR